MTQPTVSKHWRNNVRAVFVNMVFSNRDKIFISNLCRLKQYQAVELTNEFTNKYLAILQKWVPYLQQHLVLGLVGLEGLV